MQSHIKTGIALLIGLLPSPASHIEEMLKSKDLGRIYFHLATNPTQGDLQKLLPDNMIQSLDRNPKLRSELAYELLYESNRRDFQPFPVQAKTILDSLIKRYPNLSEITWPENPFAIFSQTEDSKILNQFRSLTKPTKIGQQLELFQNCQTKQLLICQATLALKLMETDELTSSEKKPIIEEGVKAARKAGHLPLMISLAPYNTLYSNNGFNENYLLLTRQLNLKEAEAHYEVFQAEVLHAKGYSFEHTEKHLQNALKLWSSDNIRSRVALDLGLYRGQHPHLEVIQAYENSLRYAQPGQERIKARALIELGKMKVFFTNDKESGLIDFENSIRISDQNEFSLLQIEGRLSLSGYIYSRTPEKSRLLLIEAESILENLNPQLKKHMRFGLYSQMYRQGMNSEVKIKLSNLEKTAAIEDIPAILDLINYVDRELGADYSIKYLISEDKPTREKATEIISFSGTNQHISELKSFLTHPDWRVRGNVIVPLARKLGPDAISLFLPLLQDEHAHVRANALVAIKNAKYTLPYSTVKILLEDPDLRVAIIAKGLLKFYQEGIDLEQSILYNPKYERLNFTETFITDSPTYDDKQILRLIQLLNSNHEHVARGAKDALLDYYSLQRWVMVAKILEQVPPHPNESLQLLSIWFRPEALQYIKTWTDSKEERLRHYYHDFSQRIIKNK